MAVDGYNAWLENKLMSLNEDVDLEVFLSYIEGILDAESTKEEKIESIYGLIREIAVDDVEYECSVIVDKWEEMQLTSQVEQKAKEEETRALKNDRPTNLMEKQNVAVIESRDFTDEQRERKNVILKQYGDISDNEEDDKKGASGGVLAKNTNTSSIEKCEKEKREKMKELSEQKRERDKTERAKQKQKDQDRKDAEKKRTQKGEKRR